MAKSAAKTITRTYKHLLKAFDDAGKQLEAEFKQLTDAQLKQEKTATIFILTWMRDNFLFQDRFNTLFKRQVSPSSADMFTAAVALSLETYLSARGIKGTVKSEFMIGKKPNRCKPDISIWKTGGELKAFVECKTNVGWNRSGWGTQYYDRTKKIQKTYPTCLSFLCFLTKKNWEKSWPTFETSPLAGNKWFCLTNVWPTDIGDSVTDHILYPIEPMFISIKEELKKGRA